MPRATTKPIKREILAPQSYLDVDVRSVMTPGVVTICESASLRQAYRAMVAHSVHAVLVIGTNRDASPGWATARAMLEHMGEDRGLIAVRHAVTEPATWIRPGACVRDALAAMKQHDTTILLVKAAEDATPEGVVTEMDLMALAAR